LFSSFHLRIPARYDAFTPTASSRAAPYIDRARMEGGKIEPIPNADAPAYC
jgi:hypothetical protein